MNPELNYPTYMGSGIFQEVNGVLYSSHTPDEVNEIWIQYKKIVNILIDNYSSSQETKQEDAVPSPTVSEKSVKEQTPTANSGTTQDVSIELRQDDSIESKQPTMTPTKDVKLGVNNVTNKGESKNKKKTHHEFVTYENAYKDMRKTCVKKLQETKKVIKNNKAEQKKVKKLGRKLRNATSITKMVKVLNNFDAILTKGKRKTTSDWIKPKLSVKIQKVPSVIDIGTNKYDILQSENDDDDMECYEVRDENFDENRFNTKDLKNKNFKVVTVVSDETLENQPEPVIYKREIEYHEEPKICSDVATAVATVISDEKIELEIPASETCKKESEILEQQGQLPKTCIKLTNTINSVCRNKKEHKLIHCDRRWTLVSSADALLRSLEESILECPQDNLIEMKQEVEQIYLNSMGTTDTVQFEAMESRFRHLNGEFLRRDEDKSSAKNETNIVHSNELEIGETEISIDQPSHITGDDSDTATKDIDSEQTDQPLVLARRNWNKHALQLRQEIDTVQGMAQDLLKDIDDKLHAGRYCDRNSKRKPVHQALKKL